jgi:molybdenum cofactor synthesis domain-containing protein
MKSLKTAGIVIIGNEILSGKVRDDNSFFLASELRSLGVHLERISIIPDNIEVIGKEVVEFSRKYDYVFTSGGVGPTHDDVTMEGIAKGFGVKLIEHQGIKNMLCSRFSDSVNSAVLKMANVPEGTEIIMNEDIRFPVICFRNIFIFPGIPEYMKNKFSLIRERFRSSEFHLKRLFLNSHESSFAEILNEVVAENKDVDFGSYPVIGKPDFRVMITAESKLEKSLEKALNDLIRRLPEDIIVKIE